MEHNWFAIRKEASPIFNACNDKNKNTLWKTWRSWKICFRQYKHITKWYILWRKNNQQNFKSWLLISKLPINSLTLPSQTLQQHYRSLQAMKSFMWYFSYKQMSHQNKSFMSKKCQNIKYNHSLWVNPLYCSIHYYRLNVRMNVPRTPQSMRKGSQVLRNAAQLKDTERVMC